MTKAIGAYPTCCRGHPLTPENKYVSKRGQTMCRECRRENAKRARKKDIEEHAKKLARKAAKKPIDHAEALKLAAAIKEIERRERERKLDFYKPYPKQLEFHALGATKHEVSLIAANRSGKTYSAAAEVAMHLTGLYPDWWPGRRFDQPTKVWSCGVSSLVVRNVNQSLLFGEHGNFQNEGTGMVPKECVDWKNDVETVRGGHANAYDTVKVKHVTGGKSMVSFRSYEMSRDKFQADTCDLIHCDEEPPEDIYAECLTRLVTTSGLMLCTFTPLLGMTAVVTRYLEDPSDDRATVNMTLDDAQHLSEEDKALAIARYLPHEREARSKGTPLFGAGLIFQVSDESITEDTIHHVPVHWWKGVGLDFGIDHPFGAVLMAWDRDADVIHVLKTVKMKDARALDHCAAMKPWGPIKTFWPHDGSVRDKGSGETLASQYKSHGAKMYSTHSSFPDGSISTWAGIHEMIERMTTGRFKVGRDCTEWLAEKRMYHTDKKHQIVKQNDDLLSATRVGLMMKRYWGGGLVGKDATVTGATMCRDVDYLNEAFP